MSKNSDNFSVDEVKKFAQSPAGQRLFQLLKQNNTQAVEQVQAGNYNDAMKQLQNFLQTPEAQKLLKDIGGSNGRP